MEECLTPLAKGFLSHPISQDLREWVGKENGLPLCRQLLPLVHGFLFWWPKSAD